MKQTLTIFLLLFAPVFLLAQSDNLVYEQISANIEGRKWAELKELFHKAVIEDADDAGTFFWKSVDAAKEGKRIMAMELGSYYREKRDYDKACPFYAEMNRLFPSDIMSLSTHAEMEVLRGREKEALLLYERVLTLDANNLAANIFIGNYYYLQADKEKKVLEDGYHKLRTPTKMQYAAYRNGVEELVNAEYSKAKVCLQRVIAQFPSTEVKKTLEKIQTVEKEINH